MKDSNKKLPCAILFDYDNTLVNSKDALIVALQTTFREMNVVLPEDFKSNPIFHRAMKDYFPGIFGNKWQIASSIFYKKYHENSHLTKPFSYVFELLEFLNENNIFSAIVSNKKGDVLRKEVQELHNWNRYFDKIIGAGDAGQDKPSHLPVMLALEGNANFKDIWFVGDSQVDIDCAINANLKPIHIGKAPIKCVSNRLMHFNNIEELYKHLTELV